MSRTVVGRPGGGTVDTTVLVESSRQCSRQHHVYNTIKTKQL